MTGSTIVPIRSARDARLRPLPEPISPASGDSVKDALGRTLRDLRVSVIDQCNQRCGYCMPRDVFHKDFVYLSRDELLSFAEIGTLVDSFISLGIRKVRLTGGEPLLRKGLEELIADLSSRRLTDGQPLELALTTNGLLLPQKARALAEAGLHRVTVSLDGISNETFQLMADTPGVGPQDVLNGIRCAQEAGLQVKANMVVQKGRNDHEILPMAEAFRELGVTLRFIEFMDVGNSNGWALDQVVSAESIVETIHAHHPLRRVERDTPSEVSARWSYDDGRGQIGLISSVTAPFCGDCSRARISAEGGLYTCLFAQHGYDLRAALERGETAPEIAGRIAAIWSQRTDRYSMLRSQHLDAEGRPLVGPDGPKVEMSYIGG